MTCLVVDFARARKRKRAAKPADASGTLTGSMGKSRRSANYLTAALAFLGLAILQDGCTGGIGSPGRNAPARAESTATCVSPLGRDPNGACGDTTIDPKNCGRCGHVCRSAACESGRCQPLVLASEQRNPPLIAVNAKAVYWTTWHTNGAVMTVPIEGGRPLALVSKQGSPLWLALNSTALFWTNSEIQTEGTVWRVPLQGGPVTIAARSPTKAGPLAIDETSVYWATHELVMKAPLAGGPSTTLTASKPSTTLTAPDGSPRGIVVDAANVYWLTQDAVMRVPLEGGPPTALATNQQSAVAIAMDDTAIYWTRADAGAGKPGSIMRKPKLGGPEVTLAEAGLAPMGIAVDETHVYWTDLENGRVMRVPIDGGTPTIVAASQGKPCGIALDATNVYWTTLRVDGCVMKLEKP